MTLPIPFRSAGKVWIEAEVAELTGGCLADARKAADQGDPYGAMLALLVGGVSRIVDDAGAVETDRGRIRAVCREMPWMDGEVLIVHTFLESGGTDEIEGAYSCPRCGRQIVCEGENADHILELPVASAELDSKITHELARPVVVTNLLDGSTMVEVVSVVLRRATMADCIKAFQKVGLSDTARFQFALYGETVQAVGGVDVDAKWRNQWGREVFERMGAGDINALTSEERRVGIQTRVSKICSGCGKTWGVDIQTMSFFASGLRRR